VRNIDKSYHEIKRFNPVKGKDSTVQFYDSGFTPNHHIRHAITGTFYESKRCSFDENLFFSVNLATGETGEKTPHCLFYHSPEEYEGHFHLKVNELVKHSWRQRYNEEIDKKSKEKSKEKSPLFVK
jgi:hypothetical protein